MISVLNNYLVYYLFTCDSKLKLLDTHQQVKTAAFIFDNQYSLYKFQGIILDSRAAGILSVRESQIQALQKRDLTIQINITVSSNTIKFRKRTATIIEVIQILIFIRVLTFHVVSINMLFLLYLQDIDALKVRFDNLRNILIQGSKIISII